MVFHTLAGKVVTGLPRQAVIVGAKGLVRRGRTSKPSSTTDMIRQVLTDALEESNLSTRDLEGLIAVPSLQENHFMEAHYQATSLDLFSTSIEEDRPLRCKTIDTGGAGPVSAVLEAQRMIQHEGLECVAVVAADCVGSMDSTSFLAKADEIFLKHGKLPSPAIPNGYDRVTKYQMETFGLTRDQLRMVVCLQSFHAGKHKDSLFYHKEKGKAYSSLLEVKESPSVTPNISLMECARRADGAACLILSSNRYLKRRGLYEKGMVTVIGTGESSGPLFPPEVMNETPFSCEEAMVYAYEAAGNLTADDIDFFGLYDCFPICLVRALEASGLCSKGTAGDYIESQYTRMMKAMGDGKEDQLLEDPDFFPVNTHGGLLCYGAPWEVPAMYHIIEAIHQLRGNAHGRQIENCRRALVYANGGIFSASAVAIFAKSL
ncbi:Non-specific lipid-transfer protein [Seminavis robusta]|uniref:Non-specific lipid-transfer protein n=1 Tax=Seminavis robusta TaxID=568900 RepID=A0A9N8EXR5_9STRA|nr:Non-specific lipid-transfer protein [Seminavis robusta]|eukprot:Sro1869_g302660.1 Non-specific lipid-transfer protein (432) ;mRNA; r:16947-18334